MAKKVLFFFALLLIFGCNKQEKPVKIAVSYITGDHATNNYIKWLKSADSTVVFVVMNDYPWDSVEIVFEQCSALLLTGGEDIYPANYGQEQDTARCGEFNFYRDSLEFLLIDLALNDGVPVLGVCRGQQILNVAMGGSLYVDIPTEFETKVYHRCEDWKNCYHNVQVLENNLLRQISGVETGRVTTNHHQAVKMLSRHFKVLAIANDGIVESIGWKEPDGKPWLLAVQWHPERMDSTNMLSGPIAGTFVAEAIKNKRD